MGAETQRRPGQGAAAVVIDLTKQITSEDSSTAINGQAVTLAAARAHLLEVIRSRPARMITVHNERRWAAGSRRDAVIRILSRMPSTMRIAAVLECSCRAVQYWRRGQRAPSVRNWQRLHALNAIVAAARPAVVTITDRGGRP